MGKKRNLRERPTAVAKINRLIGWHKSEGWFCPWCCPSAAPAPETRALGETKCSAELIEDVKIKCNQVKHDNLNELTAADNSPYLFLYVDNIYISVSVFIHTWGARGKVLSVFNKSLVSLLNIKNTLPHSSITPWAHWSIPTGISRKDRLIHNRQTNAEWGSLSQVQHLGGIKKIKKSIAINQKLPIPFYSSRKKVALCSVRQRIPGLIKKKRKDITTRKTVRNDLLFLFLNTVA